MTKTSLSRKVLKLSVLLAVAIGVFSLRDRQSPAPIVRTTLNGPGFGPDDYVTCGNIIGQSKVAKRIESLLAKAGIPCVVGGSKGYGVEVPRNASASAQHIISVDAGQAGYSFWRRSLK